MQLWTDYEGKTIEGLFPLTRLLRPEGSSAFFSTSNEDGLQRVVRLIESRPGDDDILSRWRGVAAFNHPNILKLEDFGQVVVDQTSLVYAVMEPVEATLDEVLSQHRLTVPEAVQIATSLVSVLEALHSQGFVHEHVYPLHVVAVDEVVKLQCDCIRDAPEGKRGQELKRQDVRDLSVLLLEALTQERNLEAVAGLVSLPAPFDQIVPRGISGEWGLEEIAAAISSVPSQPDDSNQATAPAAPIATPSESAPAVSETVESNVPEVEASQGPTPVQQEAELDTLIWRVRTITIALSVTVVLIMGISWYFLPNPATNPDLAPKQAVSGNPSASASPAASVKNPAAPVPVPAPAPVQATGPAAPQGQWRVIAYSYRHEQQAKKKAARILQRHPQLQVDVLRPRASGPFVIAIGGSMEQEEARSLAKRLRHEGFPNGTHAQNVSSE